MTPPITDICDGCIGLTGEFYCQVRHYTWYSNCPCLSCLVKPICTKSCQGRVDYYMDKVRKGKLRGKQIRVESR